MCNDLKCFVIYSISIVSMYSEHRHQLWTAQSMCKSAPSLKPKHIPNRFTRVITADGTSESTELGFLSGVLKSLQWAPFKNNSPSPWAPVAAVAMINYKFLLLSISLIGQTSICTYQANHYTMWYICQFFYLSTVTQASLYFLYISPIVKFISKHIKLNWILIKLTFTLISPSKLIYENLEIFLPLTQALFENHILVLLIDLCQRIW